MGVCGGERTHAGLAPSNSFVFPAMAGEIGDGLGLGFRLRDGAVEFGRGKTRAPDNGGERFYLALGAWVGSGSLRRSMLRAITMCHKSGSYTINKLLRTGHIYCTK